MISTYHDQIVEVSNIKRSLISPISLISLN